MIVEFAGAPGAGKTTLHRCVCESLTRRGITCWTGSDLSRIRRALDRPRVAGAHRRALRIGFGQLLGGGRPAAEKLFALRLLFVALEHHWTARHRLPTGELVILDEGAIQRALTVFLEVSRPVDEAALLGYLRAIPRPELLIHAKVTPETAVARLAARQRGLPRRLRADPCSSLEEAGRLVDRMVAELESSPQARVAVLTLPDSSGQDSVRAVESRILRLLAHSHHGPR